MLLRFQIRREAALEYSLRFQPQVRGVAAELIASPEVTEARGAICVACAALRLGACSIATGR